MARYTVTVQATAEVEAPSRDAAAAEIMEQATFALEGALGARLQFVVLARSVAEDGRSE